MHEKKISIGPGGVTDISIYAGEQKSIEFAIKTTEGVYVDLKTRGYTTTVSVGQDNSNLSVSEVTVLEEDSRRGKFILSLSGDYVGNPSQILIIVEVKKGAISLESKNFTVTINKARSVGVVILDEASIKDFSLGSTIGISAKVLYSDGSLKDDPVIFKLTKRTNDVTDVTDNFVKYNINLNISEEGSYTLYAYKSGQPSVKSSDLEINVRQKPAFLSLVEFAGVTINEKNYIDQSFNLIKDGESPSLKLQYLGDDGNPNLEQKEEGWPSFVVDKPNLVSVSRDDKIKSDPPPGKPGTYGFTLKVLKYDLNDIEDFEEIVTLSDTSRKLLLKTEIELNSILVKSLDGSITYTLKEDYDIVTSISDVTRLGIVRRDVPTNEIPSSGGSVKVLYKYREKDRNNVTITFSPPGNYTTNKDTKIVKKLEIKSKSYEGLILRGLKISGLKNAYYIHEDISFKIEYVGETKGGPLELAISGDNNNINLISGEGGKSLTDLISFSNTTPGLPFDFKLEVDQGEVSKVSGYIKFNNLSSSNSQSAWNSFKTQIKISLIDDSKITGISEEIELKPSPDFIEIVPNGSFEEDIGKIKQIFGIYNYLCKKVVIDTFSKIKEFKVHFTHFGGTVATDKIVTTDEITTFTDNLLDFGANSWLKDLFYSKLIVNQERPLFVDNFKGDWAGLIAWFIKTSKDVLIRFKTDIFMEYFLKTTAKVAKMKIDVISKSGDIIKTSGDLVTEEDINSFFGSLLSESSLSDTLEKIYKYSKAYKIFQNDPVTFSFYEKLTNGASRKPNKPSILKIEGDLLKSENMLSKFVDNFDDSYAIVTTDKLDPGLYVIDIQSEDKLISTFAFLEVIKIQKIELYVDDYNISMANGLLLTGISPDPNTTVNIVNTSTGLSSIGLSSIAAIGSGIVTKDITSVAGGAVTLFNMDKRVSDSTIKGIQPIAANSEKEIKFYAKIIFSDGVSVNTTDPDFEEKLYKPETFKFIAEPVLGGDKKLLLVDEKTGEASIDEEAKKLTEDDLKSFKITAQYGGSLANPVFSNPLYININGGIKWNKLTWNFDKDDVEKWFKPTLDALDKISKVLEVVKAIIDIIKGFILGAVDLFNSLLQLLVKLILGLIKMIKNWGLYIMFVDPLPNLRRSFEETWKQITSAWEKANNYRFDVVHKSAQGIESDLEKASTSGAIAKTEAITGPPKPAPSVKPETHGYLYMLEKGETIKQVALRLYSANDNNWQSYWSKIEEANKPLMDNSLLKYKESRGILSGSKYLILPNIDISKVSGTVKDRVLKIVKFHTYTVTVTDGSEYIIQIIKSYKLDPKLWPIVWVYSKNENKNKKPPIKHWNKIYKDQKILVPELVPLNAITSTTAAAVASTPTAAASTSTPEVEFVGDVNEYLSYPIIHQSVNSFLSFSSNFVANTKDPYWAQPLNTDGEVILPNGKSGFLSYIREKTLNKNDTKSPAFADIPIPQIPGSPPQTSSQINGIVFCLVAPSAAGIKKMGEATYNLAEAIKDVAKDLALAFRNLAFVSDYNWSKLIENKIDTSDSCGVFRNSSDESDKDGSKLNPLLVRYDDECKEYIKILTKNLLGLLSDDVAQTASSRIRDKYAKLRDEAIENYREHRNGIVLENILKILEKDKEYDINSIVEKENEKNEGVIKSKIINSVVIKINSGKFRLSGSSDDNIETSTVASTKIDRFINTSVFQSLERGGVYKIYVKDTIERPNVLRNLGYLLEKKEEQFFNILHIEEVFNNIKSTGIVCRRLNSLNFIPDLLRFDVNEKNKNIDKNIDKNNKLAIYKKFTPEAIMSSTDPVLYKALRERSGEPYGDGLPLAVVIVPYDYEMDPIIIDLRRFLSEKEQFAKPKVSGKTASAKTLQEVSDHSPWKVSRLGDIPVFKEMLESAENFVEGFLRYSIQKEEIEKFIEKISEFIDKVNKVVSLIKALLTALSEFIKSLNDVGLYFIKVGFGNEPANSTQDFIDKIEKAENLPDQPDFYYWGLVVIKADPSIAAISQFFKAAGSPVSNSWGKFNESAKTSWSNITQLSQQISDILK